MRTIWTTHVCHIILDETVAEAKKTVKSAQRMLGTFKKQHKSQPEGIPYGANQGQFEDQNKYKSNKL